MDQSSTQTADEDISPQAEPGPTPLVSAAQIPLDEHPIVHIESQRRSIVEQKARQISDAWSGSPSNHEIGKLGEDAALQYLGIADRLNLEVIPDGGDGGIDSRYRGVEVQIKTVGRQYMEDPELWVDAYKPLKADYYVLVSRVGVADFRLVGYAPRWFVANAPQRTHNGGVYHVVDREYLFPFTRSRP